MDPQKGQGKTPERNSSINPAKGKGGEGFHWRGNAKHPRFSEWSIRGKGKRGSGGLKANGCGKQKVKGRHRVSK